ITPLPPVIGGAGGIIPITVIPPIIPTIPNIGGEGGGAGGGGPVPPVTPPVTIPTTPLPPTNPPEEPGKDPRLKTLICTTRTVQRGQTIESLAQSSGASPNDIREINGITSIRPGQTIRLPIRLPTPCCE
ncbi:LysM peptidoglycan-binding domain-containing protein, partial [Verrucomicrobiales bacterium]|nr:LysM peptidoglycan-binding domain-containing protein [Verrucomicrobiales bacterium]